MQDLILQVATLAPKEGEREGLVLLRFGYPAMKIEAVLMPAVARDLCAAILQAADQVAGETSGLIVPGLVVPNGDLRGGRSEPRGD